MSANNINGLKLQPQDFEVNPQGQVVIKNEKVAALLKEHSIVTPQGKSHAAAAVSVGVVVSF